MFLWWGFGAIAALVGSMFGGWLYGKFGGKKTRPSASRSCFSVRSFYYWRRTPSACICRLPSRIRSAGVVAGIADRLRTDVGFRVLFILNLVILVALDGVGTVYNIFFLSAGQGARLFARPPRLIFGGSRYADRFHAHVFLDKLAPRAVQSLAERAHIVPHTDGTSCATTQRVMREGGVDRFVCLNIAVARARRRTSTILRSPFSPSRRRSRSARYIRTRRAHWTSWRRRPRRASAASKFHNEYQDFYVDDKRAFPLYERCAEYGMIMLFHGGADWGISTARQGAAAADARRRGRLPAGNRSSWRTSAGRIWQRTRSAILPTLPSISIRVSPPAPSGRAGRTGHPRLRDGNASCSERIAPGIRRRTRCGICARRIFRKRSWIGSFPKTRCGCWESYKKRKLSVYNGPPCGARPRRSPPRAARGRFFGIF